MDNCANDTAVASTQAPAAGAQDPGGPPPRRGLRRVERLRRAFQRPQAGLELGDPRLRRPVGLLLLYGPRLGRPAGLLLLRGPRLGRPAGDGLLLPSPLAFRVREEVLPRRTIVQPQPPLRALVA